MSKTDYQRVTIADRILGGLGGAFLGFVTGLCVLASTNWQIPFLFALLIIVATTLGMTLFGMFRPIYPMRWSMLTLMFFVDDPDSDLPARLFICHVLGIIAILLLLFATVFRVQMVFLVGIILLVPITISLTFHFDAIDRQHQDSHSDAD